MIPLALLTLGLTCAHGADAPTRTLVGPKAEALYNALIDAGYDSDSYAGGTGVQGAVRCQMSRNAPPKEAYHCEVPVAGVGDAAEGASAAQSTESPDALDKMVERTTSQIRGGQLALARTGLGALEKAAGPAGDYAEKAQGLRRYLTCEEDRAKGADSGSASREKIESDVLYAMKLNDVRRLAPLLSCDGELARPNSEPETSYTPQTMARTVMAQREGNIKVGSRGTNEITVQGFKLGAQLTLQFRQQGPSGRWYLNRVGFPAP